jgi:uncharacterized membrane-anchored protein YitT (DUF2179 family)
MKMQSAKGALSFVRGILTVAAKEWKSLIVVTVGVTMNAAAVAYFTLPYRFPDLGVSGLAVLANYTFGISPAWVIVIGNLILFGWGWRELSPRFVFLSVYSVLLFGLALEIFRSFPVEPLDDRFLAAVISGMVKGVSAAMVFREGGSGGGTDVIAAILRGRYGVELGKFSVFINAVILGMALGIVGLRATIYGLVGLYVFGVMLDNTMQSFDRRKQAFVVTSSPREVSAFIMSLGRGTTLVMAEGGFTGEVRPIVVSLLDKHQMTQLKAYLREHDPNAFVSVCDAAEVVGNGFKNWTSL